MIGKIIKGLGIGLVSLALPLAAFAATAPNISFPNGDVTISGQGGQTTNATFRIVVPVNQVVEQVCTDVLGDALSESAPVSVGEELGLQEGTHDITLPIKFPPNTNTYTVQIRGAGIYGGIRSVDCNDNTVLPATTFGSALRVVSNSSNTTGGGSTPAPAWQAAIDALNAQIEALTKSMTSLATLVGSMNAGGTKPACPPSGNTSMVQTWLLNNGYAAGFHAAGVYTATGYWGSITAAAYAQAMAACK